MKILVILACSKSKRKFECKAEDLNIGQLFNSIKQFCYEFEFPFLILSAKYGLIKPEKIIAPYDNKIKYVKHIKELQLSNDSIIHEINQNYEKVLLIMGRTYKKVLENIDSNIRVSFYDNRGIGGYKQLMVILSNMNKKSLLSMINNNSFIDIETIKKYNNSL